MSKIFGANVRIVKTDCKKINPILFHDIERNEIIKVFSRNLFDPILNGRRGYFIRTKNETP